MNNTWKKLFALTLAVLLVLATFAACGKKTSGSKDTKAGIFGKDASVKQSDDGTTPASASTDTNDSAFRTNEYITFGTYEQDNNTANGAEPIEWLVLAKDGDKALIISKYGLDSHEYGSSADNNGETNTWENSRIRTWLNDTFLNTAFDAAEQSRIQTITVTAEKNPEYDPDPGNNTQDRIFLLSISEARQYFDSKESRMCVPTDYAIAQGVEASGSQSTCYWWLRNPGIYDTSAADVDIDGSVSNFGWGIANTNLAVRPAMWITLDA